MGCEAITWVHQDHLGSHLGQISAQVHRVLHVLADQQHQGPQAVGAEAGGGRDLYDQVKKNFNSLFPDLLLQAE